MGTLGRRVDQLERQLGDDDEPTLIRSYRSSETGATERLHIRHGIVQRIEHVDRDGHPIERWRFA